MRGRVIGVGTRGCTGCIWGLTGMGVRMGMADIADMDDRPTDRFGIEPIPVKRKHIGEREEVKNTFRRQTNNTLTGLGCQTALKCSRLGNWIAAPVSLEKFLYQIVLLKGRLKQNWSREIAS